VNAVRPTYQTYRTHKSENTKQDEIQRISNKMEMESIRTILIYK
jgi:hypothetical protein